MGGGLLQKVNRDTMSFATKLSHVVYADGTPADIMKTPTGDSAKISFPGETFLESLATLTLREQPPVFCSTSMVLSVKLGCFQAP
jgi:hypothetical protein